jgi:hypothetical protein
MKTKYKDVPCNIGICSWHNVCNVSELSHISLFRNLNTWSLLSSTSRGPLWTIRVKWDTLKRKLYSELNKPSCILVRDECKIKAGEWKSLWLQFTEYDQQMHVCKMCLTCFSIPTCFDHRCDHHQGHFQDYKDSKQTFKMHNWTTQFDEACLKCQLINY